MAQHFDKQNERKFKLSALTDEEIQSFMESVLLQMHSFYTAETTQIKIMLSRKTSQLYEVRIDLGKALCASEKKLVKKLCIQPKALGLMQLGTFQSGASKNSEKCTENQVHILFAGHQFVLFQ